MTTPTPRTDELIKKHSIGHTNGSLHYLMEELARQLERDLAAALERINKSEADIAAMTTYAKTQQDRALAAEARAEALRQREETFRALIADDAYAASFQTLGQFRTSILGWIDERNDIDAIAEGK